jgi:hypothetical protein
MTSVYVIHSQYLDKSGSTILGQAYADPAMAGHVLRALQNECSDKSYRIFTLDLLESQSKIHGAEEND